MNDGVVRTNELMYVCDLHLASKPKFRISLHLNVHMSYLGNQRVIGRRSASGRPKSGERGDGASAAINGIKVHGFHPHPAIFQRLLSI